MKELEGLRICQRHVERLGCIKGCLDYLGAEISFPWLYGGTGHAFIISLDPGVDVSSPDSWDHQPQYDLGRNLGYAINGFWAWKPDNEESFQCFVLHTLFIFCAKCLAVVHLPSVRCHIPDRAHIGK